MIGLLGGAGFGAGLLVVLSAFGARESLASVWDQRVREAWLVEVDGLERSRWQRLVQGRLDGNIGRLLSDSGLDAAAAMAGADRTVVVSEALIKAAVTVVLVGVVAAVWTGSPIGATGFMLAVGAGLLTMALSLRLVYVKAKERRAEMLEALAAFMEFTRLSAATQSTEGAMRTAVTAGSTWAFDAIAVVFSQAELRGEAPWDGLGRLGARYQMPELVDLAVGLRNAGHEGTRVSEMLSAKSTALRRRLTEAEVTDAESRSQKIIVPLSLIAFVVVVLLMAPALLVLGEG